MRAFFSSIVFFCILFLFFYLQDKIAPLSEDVLAYKRAGELSITLLFCLVAIPLVVFFENFRPGKKKEFWEKRSYRKKHSPFYRHDMIVVFSEVVFFVILILFLGLHVIFTRVELTSSGIRKLNLFNHVSSFYPVQEFSTAETGLDYVRVSKHRSEPKMFIKIHVKNKKFDFHSFRNYSPCTFYDSYRTDFPIAVKGRQYEEKYIRQHPKLSQEQISDLHYLLSLEN